MYQGGICSFVFIKIVFMIDLTRRQSTLELEISRFGEPFSEISRSSVVYNELIKISDSAELDDHDRVAILDRLYYRDVRGVVSRAFWGKKLFDYFFPNFEDHKSRNRRAFAVPFLFRDEILKPLIADLADKLANRHCTISSFVEFVGGRTEGKSRALLQLAYCGISMAYFNARNEKSTSYPQRTCHIANFFEQEDLTEIDVMAIFVAYLDYASLFFRDERHRSLPAITASLHEALLEETTQKKIILLAAKITQELSHGAEIYGDSRPLFHQRISAFSKKQKELKRTIERRFPLKRDTVLEQAAQSGIQFLFIFDHTSRLLGRNWPLISEVLIGLPKVCGVLALRCSLSIDPKWPVVSGVLSSMPYIAERVQRRFGPSLDSKISNHDEKVDYLGTIFLKCQHVWPEVPGSPGSLQGSLHGTAMNYAELISGCTTKVVIDHICGIVLQHRHRYRIPSRHPLNEDLEDFCVSEKSIGYYKKGNRGAFYSQFGCIYSTDHKKLMIKERPNTCNSITASYIVSKFEVPSSLSAFKSREYNQYLSAQILIRVCEQLQTGTNYVKGVQSLFSYIPYVSLEKIIGVVCSPFKNHKPHEIQEYLCKIRGLRARLISIVGCYRKPRIEDLQTSAKNGFGWFVSNKIKGYNAFFGTFDDDGTIVPVFLRGFFFGRAGIDKDRVDRALYNIDLQARKFGSKRHVVILFHGCRFIKEEFHARQTSPTQVCFEFQNAKLSDYIHKGVREVADSFQKPRWEKYLREFEFRAGLGSLEEAY